MSENKKFYITTPIYYPSGKFHIGTSYTTTLAYAIKKYRQLRGYDAYMLTGLDEHGQKIQEVAISRGKTPQEHVDEMAENAKELWAKMKIDYDDFIRTTEPRHEKVVEKIFTKFMENGDIYKGEYEGWYCTPCETYFTPTQLVDGKCPDCDREVKKMKEEAYFFNMKKYQDRLVKFYEENPHFIDPEFRKNEIFNNFIKPGLEDLCVTRTSFDWGIKVKGDEKHVVYVWLDALTNYITALGYMSEDETKFNKYWPADLQIVGKDIIRFHGIYWPIFLMALDLPIPKKLLVHGWIMMKDGKMSKSKGNVIYPETLIDRYGLDATKYFLLKELNGGQDGLFTPEGFVERYNSELCNDLGNLLNRTIGMINKYFGGAVPEKPKTLTDLDKELESFIESQIKLAEGEFDESHVANALEEIWKIIARANKYIDETMPWALFKEEKIEELADVMYHLVETLRKVAILIMPCMEETSEKMFKQLGIEDANLKTWESAKEHANMKDLKVVEKGEPIFVRLDLETETEFLKNEMSK
ncbi:MAG: methionine--tRNA ligase [Clostridia bacterium]